MRDLHGPGANVAELPASLVRRRLDSLLDELGQVAPAACCAGAAGAEVGAGRQRLERILRQRFPDSRVDVVHDARLVLAAVGVDEGIALIAGTGSVAYGRSADGREARAGGWGWMLGDEGSGVWIVREGVREVLRRADDGLAPGPLGDAMFAATRTRSATELSGRLHSMREPMRWAALAPSVFEAAETDPGARQVIERAAEALSGLVRSVRDAIHVDGPIVLAGGVLLNQPRLETALLAIATGHYVRLEEPPVAGAVRLAERLIAT